MDNVIKIIETLNNLKYIKRTGPTLFAGISTNQTESIAEHSFKVANLVLLLGGKVSSVNIPNVVTHAISHDWQESVIGDIPTGSRSWKQYFENADIREIFKKAEEKVRSEMFIDSGIVLPELSKTEQDLLMLCDGLAIILELVDYKQKGNSHNWIKKMFDVQISITKGYEFDFVPDLVTQLDRIFNEGMDNYYLTRATSNLSTK